jgi:uncharacterized protein (TIGR03437 family)
MELAMKESTAKTILARFMMRAVVIAVLATMLGMTGVAILPGQEMRGIFNDADRSWHQSEIDDGWRVRIAQGAVFLLSGSNLATSSQVAGSSRLPLELGGTSVQVIVGDARIDAPLISVSSGFVRAVLPAGTPEGVGNVVVRHSGRESFPRELRVVRQDFRLYGRSQSAVLAHNIAPKGELSANSYRQPARPGQLVVLWGTGLGAHSELGTVEVLVGGSPAPVHYAGPSECCPGQDQIVFEVPAGIEGCHVPVKVKFPGGGLESNSPSLSIAAAEGPCSDPYGIPINLLEPGVLDFGNIIGHARDPGDVPTPIELEHGTTDVGGDAWFIGSFWRGLPATAKLPPLGTCFGEPGTIGPWFPSSSYVRPFDAGAGLNLRGPQGPTYIPRRATDQTGSVGYGIVGPDRLEAGEYVLDNGEGSSRIEPFQTTFTLRGGSFEWTNKEGFGVAAIQNGAPIKWSGGDPAGGFVLISAWLGRWVEDWVFGEQQLNSVTCVENVEKQSFTLPRSVVESVAEADLLTVRVAYVFHHRFPGAGLDLVEFSYRFGTTARIPLR